MKFRASTKTWMAMAILFLSALFLASCGGTETGNPAEQSNGAGEELSAPTKDAENDCAQDVKVCEDDSTVSRNPELHCEFDPCPEDEE